LELQGLLVVTDSSNKYHKKYSKCNTCAIIPSFFDTLVKTLELEINKIYD
jgi:hypothetical protein